MPDSKLADQLKRILQRLDAIEEQIQRSQTNDDESVGTVAKQCYCCPLYRSVSWKPEWTPVVKASFGSSRRNGLTALGEGIISSP